MKLSDRFIKAWDELCDFEHAVPAPLFRKSFDLDFVPDAARLTVTGQGFYALFVNGKEITRCPLAPYISNPDDLLWYDEYDLLPYLKKGENVIGLILGNGMRNAFGGFVWDFEKATSRGPLCLALAFEASGEGKTLAFEADDSFRTHKSPILYDDIRLGYTYDSRKEIPGWCEPGFDDTGWGKAKFCFPPRGEKRLSLADPIVVRERIKPKKITHYDSLAFSYTSYRADAKPLEETVRKNVYVYDFGINTAGLTELRIDGVPGQRITIRHGEHLTNGNFSIDTTIFKGEEREKIYLEHGQKDEFILKGGEEVLLPRFKYDGFRYAFVEGLTPEQATEDALTFVVMSSDLKVRGGFTSSSEDLNRLYAMIRNSDLSNFVWFPTDCPHREKNGWTGDASMSAEHMLLSLRAATSMKAWLASIRKAQDERGALPGIVPTGGWGFAWGNGPAWDSVAVSLPYNIYRFDGDASVIEENVEMILRYLSYVRTRRDEKGLVAIGLGDWVDPFRGYDSKPNTPLCVTDTIMCYEIASRAAFLFGEIGRAPESRFAAEIAEEFRTAVRTHLIDFSTMTVSGDHQTAQAFALDAGIFNASELPAARARLLAIIERDLAKGEGIGYVNTCGMIGLRHIYRALDAAGENELAYKLITSRERSCYGAWLDAGHTAAIENFPERNGDGVCSENHHFLGDISAWMTECVAGLCPNPTLRDTTDFEIRPDPIAPLSFAEAYFAAKEGKLRTRWERTPDGVRVDVSVPRGMHGRLVTPRGCEDLDEHVLHLNPGEHRFVFKNR